MKIVIDGDSQPAKKGIIDTAKKYGIKAVIVCSVAHFTENTGNGYPEIILVDNRKQEADIKIMNMTEAGDIVITDDTGLGYVLAGRGAYIITGRGKVLNRKELDIKIEAVHAEKKLMRSRTRIKTRIKGAGVYKKEDRKRLIKVIEKIIRTCQGSPG